MNVLIVSLLLPIFPVMEDGPNKAVPELQVLSKYVGTWDADIKGELVIKAVMTVKWILNGNYLEMETIISEDSGTFDKKKSKTFMTYDREKKVYRTWSFDDMGQTVVTEGSWNSKSQTMTMTERIGEITITSTADFSKSGIIEWHGIVSDKDGKFIKEATSVSKRRK